MVWETIYLDADDDIVSICDRLDWLAADVAQVILVLPDDAALLQVGLDLVRVRRHADRRRLAVGLVTTDMALTRQAQALGIPTFRSEVSAQRSRRGWWRGRRRREWVGVPTLAGVGLKAWRQQVHPDAKKDMRVAIEQPLWRRWLWRYVALFVFVVGLSLVLVATVYMLPRATILLHPQVQPVTTTRRVVADPTLTTVDYGVALVPGRVLTVTQSWQADVETTGTVLVPSTPARGRVVFVNQLAEVATIPVGTRVATVAGLVFETIETVAMPDVVGSTVEVDVVAMELGPIGNVAAELITQIEGDLALQLTVSNLEPLVGGDVRDVAVVTAADQARLRREVVQFLQAVAIAEMEAQLTAEALLAAGSVQIVQVLAENYSAGIGTQTERLSLAMEAVLAGTAVDTSEATGLVYESLVTQVPLAYTLVPDSITFENGAVLGSDEQGRMTFEMVGHGVAAAQLEVPPFLALVAGQSIDVAGNFLMQQLPLRQPPVITVWPAWFDRMPYRAARIEPMIETGDV